MQYLGTFNTGESVYAYFNTKSAAQAPATLSGTPSCQVYKNDGTTEDNSGVTLTVDFGGITGLNLVVVDTSTDSAFYTSGGEFAIKIHAGTVDSISVVGTIVAQFSLV